MKCIFKKYKHLKNILYRKLFTINLKQNNILHGIIIHSQEILGKYVTYFVFNYIFKPCELKILLKKYWVVIGILFAIGKQGRKCLSL